ncbi:MAG TPA: ABC transporter permease [Candidatus Deferrimicrobium sp.]|nr:ABC transporter permease [Candidatus Deferrimicrobium sp.]
MFERIKRTLSLAQKEIESLLKDKQALIIIFLLPTLVIFAIGSSSGGGSAHATIGIVDLDTTSGANFPGPDLSENLTATIDYIENTDIIIFNNIADANLSLYLGEIDGILIIPDMFEQNLSSEELPRIALLELFLDDTDFGAAGVVIGKVELAIYVFKYNLSIVRDEIIYVPTFQFSSSSSLYRAAPAVFCITILGSTMMTAAQSIVGDVPLRRMLLTPARKTEILLSKLMAYLLIVFLQIQIILGISWGIFGLPIECGYWRILVLLFITGMSGVTLGIFISVVSTSRLQASQYFLLAFILMFVLTWFGGLEFLKEVIPLYRAQTAFGMMAYKGFTLFDARWDILTIFLFGFISYLLAHISFHFKKSVI